MDQRGVAVPPDRAVGLVLLRPLPAPGPGRGCRLRHPRPGPGAQVPQRRGRRLRPRRGGDVHRLRVPGVAGRGHAAVPVGGDPARDRLRHPARRGAGDRALARVRGGARDRHVLADLPAVALGERAQPGLRLGRRDARAAGDRRPQLRHDGEVDGGDPPQRAVRDRQRHGPLGPPVVRGHRRRDRGGAGAGLPLHALRPGHAGERRERGGRGARRALGRPHRRRQLDHRHRPGGHRRHPDRAGLDRRPDLLHAVHRPGARRRARRALQLVRDRGRRRSGARHAAVGGHQAADGVGLAARARRPAGAAVRADRGRDDADVARGRRARGGGGAAQPVARPARRGPT